MADPRSLESPPNQLEPIGAAEISERAGVASNLTLIAQLEPAPTVVTEINPNTSIAHSKPAPNSTHVENNPNLSVVETETTSKPADFEAFSLWEEAYQKLRDDDSDLIRDLETIIKHDTSLDPKSDIKSQMPTVIDRQKTRMETKQWSFKILGKEVGVRAKVDALFSLIDSSKDLIAAGMTFAPVYISLPWTAFSSLIPVGHLSYLV